MLFRVYGEPLFKAGHDESFNNWAVGETVFRKQLV